jgi:hypothetical protein
MSDACFASAKNKIRRMATAALVLLSAQAPALANEGVIERHWSKPAYMGEIHLQLWLIGGAAAVYCLLRIVGKLAARRRAS